MGDCQHPRSQVYAAPLWDCKLEVTRCGACGDVWDPETRLYIDYVEGKTIVRAGGESEFDFNARKGKIEAARLDARKSDEGAEDAMTKATAVWAHLSPNVPR